MIAITPNPPYYAVIFTSILVSENKEYDAMAEKMLKLAQQQEGFLGIESVRDQIGITVSYWRSLEAIQKWKHHTEHIIAQEKGKTEWYRQYKIRIAKVEKDYYFESTEIF